MNHNGNLLIVDDEPIVVKTLERAMRKEGYEVKGSTSGANAIRIMERQEFDVVLTDLRMKKVDGMQVLSKCRELYPDSEVIMITAHASLPSAVETIKKGAFTYLEKPVEIDEIRKVVASAIERVKLRKDNAQLREQIEHFKGKIKIITQEPAMQRLIESARQIGPTDCNVIISGESGTGKELLARYIHLSSRRSDGPFFSVNCGAFTDSLLNGELFGYEKGALNGVSEIKKGLLEMASGGTLFLNEITEINPSLQVKLLGVIQEKEVLRPGSTEPVKVDVRFISAANSDLKESVRGGSFREDLFFKLNVVSFHIPPLCERRNDVPLLSYYFLKRFAAIMDKDVSEISPDVLSILMNYDFPGNVRELENIIERGVALAHEKNIGYGHLPEDIREMRIRTFRRKEGRIPTLHDQEMEYIKWVLKEVGGNMTLAARTLGIDRVSLWRKLKKSGNQ